MSHLKTASSEELRELAHREEQQHPRTIPVPTWVRVNGIVGDFKAFAGPASAELWSRANPDKVRR